MCPVSLQAGRCVHYDAFPSCCSAILGTGFLLVVQDGCLSVSPHGYILVSRREEGTKEAPSYSPHKNTTPARVQLSRISSCGPPSRKGRWETESSLKWPCAQVQIRGSLSKEDYIMGEGQVSLSYHKKNSGLYPKSDGVFCPKRNGFKNKNSMIIPPF